MSSAVVCPNCNTRLVYQGSEGGKVKPCPKCQTPIAFVMPPPLPKSPEPPKPTEVVAEVVAAKPTIAAPVTAPPQRSSWPIIVPILLIGGGGFAALMLMCGGLAVLGFLLDRQGTSTSVPVPSPAPVSISTTYDPPSYTAPSYTAPATYSEPIYTPVTESYATAPAPAYDPNAYATPAPAPAPADNFWNFGVDRASELQAAIDADTKRLADLDAQIFLSGATGGLGGVAEQRAETAADQVLGALINAGAQSIKQQLQSERDSVQIRLNANRAELARLQSGT
jgi:hypothetical protein